MVNKCFVPRCKSGYSLKKRNENPSGKVSLFRAPKDKDALKKWDLAIPRKDRKLTSKDFVCELHFKEDEIKRYFDAEETLKRESPRLLPDAVPSQFPKCPEHLSKKIRPPRKSWRERVACDIPAVKVTKIRGNGSNANPSNNDESGPSTLDESTFTVFASIIEPNLEPLTNVTFQELETESFSRENWSKLVVRNTIRYLYWPENELLCSKYIEIGTDMTVKVVFGKVCTGFVGYKTLTNLNKLNELIRLVEKADICHGAISNKHKRCGGFAKKGHLCGFCTLRNTLANGGKKTKNLARYRCRQNQNMKRKMGRLQAKLQINFERLEALIHCCLEFVVHCQSYFRAVLSMSRIILLVLWM